jgi:hypothetical protein
MADMERTAVGIKAELLANGVRPTSAFLEAYGPPLLSKRRAYGNPDDLEFLERQLPQELYIMPDRLVCSVNARTDSSWLLDWSPAEGFTARCGDAETRLSFPLTPAFYAARMSDSRLVQDVVTLYGGGSLGIFIHGNCSLVDLSKPCQYCSISPNRSREGNFPQVVSEAMLVAALEIALADTGCPILQVMINGGNFRDPDRSFLYYARLCAAARRVINASGREVELHLIVYPPADLSLLQALEGLDLSVAMNLEVFDPSLFKSHCPGKDAVLGQEHILAALSQAVRCLGAGKVFSIMVGGLEEQESMSQGMGLLASSGVIPIINVFHPDPETPLAGRPAPSVERIMEMGKELQRIFGESEFSRPFYQGCGRNSLDSEAHLRLF